MSRFRLLLLSGAAMAAASGCSSAAPPEESGSPPLPVTAASGAAVVSRTGPTTLATESVAVLTVSDTRAPAANTALLAARDPKEMVALRTVALGVAAKAGVSSPAAFQAVAALHRQAAASVLSDAVIQDHASVYVVKVMGGPFTSPRHPPGVTPRGYAFLTVAVDAATKRVTDIDTPTWSPT